jgi:hypothetical protein
MVDNNAYFYPQIIGLSSRNKIIDLLLLVGVLAEHSCLQMRSFLLFPINENGMYVRT